MLVYQMVYMYMYHSPTKMSTHRITTFWQECRLPLFFQGAVRATNAFHHGFTAFISCDSHDFPIHSPWFQWFTWHEDTSCLHPEFNYGLVRLYHTICMYIYIYISNITCTYIIHYIFHTLYISYIIYFIHNISHTILYVIHILCIYINIHILI